MTRPSTLQLYAAGLNAHGQLLDNGNKDVLAFETVPGTRTSNLQVLYAGWSSTTISLDGNVVGLGNQTFSHSFQSGETPPRDGIGDHNGMNCGLTADSRLYVVEQKGSSSRLLCMTIEDSPQIGFLALAQNGRLALTFKQAPEGRLCHVVEFEHCSAFLRWYSDPSVEGNYPVHHHMLPGRPKQLLASTATFILLMEDGIVYTWGDNRYQSLGRSLSGTTDCTADKPAVVEALDGVHIVALATGTICKGGSLLSLRMGQFLARMAKLLAQGGGLLLKTPLALLLRHLLTFHRFYIGGWISAALSVDGALYVWGAHTPGCEGSIKALVAGKISLVDIQTGHDAQPLDIVDVAVGNNHVAALAENGSLFVVGDNRNGQLGIGVPAGFLEGWQEVRQLANVQKVFCGPEATFAIVQDM